MVAIGNFFFHWRNTLFPFACLLVLLPGEPIFDDPLDAGLLGFGVAMAGQFVRAFTIGFEYVIRGGRNRRVYAENLVTEGVYQFSRNPMYVGNLLILLGLALASDNWTTFAITVPFFVFVYIAIVAAEEHFLRGKFGEAFDRYCADVPRWLPGPMTVARAGLSGAFHWRRMVVKEFHTPFGWMTMMLLVVLWRIHALDQWRQNDDEIAALAQAYTVVVLAWLTLRFLKKTKRLVAD